MSLEVPCGLTKSEWRQLLRIRRQKLNAEFRLQAAHQALELLQGWPVFQQAQVVHCFLSQPEEFFTKPLIQACWAQQKIVVVPWMTPKSKELGHSRLDHFEALGTGAFGIPEPLPSLRQAVPLKNLELVLIPGLGFDHQGTRLGFGRGYYDRFLAQIPQAFRLGLAFDTQYVEELPKEAHDLPMHGLLTETQLLFFG